jgi:hypothetical protein
MPASMPGGADPFCRTSDGTRIEGHVYSGRMDACGHTVAKPLDTNVYNFGELWTSQSECSTSHHNSFTQPSHEGRHRNASQDYQLLYIFDHMVGRAIFIDELLSPGCLRGRRFVHAPFFRSFDRI